MRSNLWILLLCFHFLGVAAFAQDLARRQLVLQVSNGGFVSFRSETPGSHDQPDGKSLATVGWDEQVKVWDLDSNQEKWSWRR